MTDPIFVPGSSEPTFSMLDVPPILSLVYRISRTMDDLALVENLANTFQSFFERLTSGQPPSYSSHYEHLCEAFLAQTHAIVHGPSGSDGVRLAEHFAECTGLNVKSLQVNSTMWQQDLFGTEKSTASGITEIVPGPIFGNVIVFAGLDQMHIGLQNALAGVLRTRKVPLGPLSIKQVQPFFVIGVTDSGSDTFVKPSLLREFSCFCNLQHSWTVEDLVRTDFVQHGGGAALEPSELREFMHVVSRVPIPDHLFKFANEIFRILHEGEWFKEFVHGELSRSSLATWQVLAQARALIKGSTHVRREDFMETAISALSNHVELTFSGQSEGLDISDVINRAAADVGDEI